jgi:hypothetical protein
MTAFVSSKVQDTKRQRGPILYRPRKKIHLDCNLIELDKNWFRHYV